MERAKLRHGEYKTAAKVYLAGCAASPINFGYKLPPSPSWINRIEKLKTLFLLITCIVIANENCDFNFSVPKKTK